MSTITGLFDRPGWRTYEIVGVSGIRPLEVRYQRHNRRVDFAIFDGSAFCTISGVKMRMYVQGCPNIDAPEPTYYEVHHWRRLTREDRIVIVDSLIQMELEHYQLHKRSVEAACATAAR